MLVKQSDYHRIYKVINSLVDNGQPHSAGACMFFATFGAFILKQQYKVEATVRGGLAAYNLDGTLLLFGDHREDGYVSGAGANYHCWVEAEGWAIDFMAPAFADSAAHLGVPSKMFQKPLASMAPTINDLRNSGDFFYRAEPQAMARRFADWQKEKVIGDLATIAANWFRKSPKAIQAAIAATDRQGKPVSIPLRGHVLAGTW